MIFSVYFRGVVQSIVMSDVIMGLLKSIAFATIIVHVGCLEGLRVPGGPDAVGRSATCSGSEINVYGDSRGRGAHGHFLPDRRRLIRDGGANIRPRPGSQLRWAPYARRN
jgi:hypothetical protein